MRKLRMNLLQSNTIWGYLLPSFSSKCSYNCMRKSLHSSMILRQDDKSVKMLVIFLMSTALDCSLPSSMDFIKISTYLKLSLSFKESALLIMPLSEFTLFVLMPFSSPSLLFKTSI